MKANVGCDPTAGQRTFLACSNNLLASEHFLKKKVKGVKRSYFLYFFLTTNHFAREEMYLLGALTEYDKTLIA